MRHAPAGSTANCSRNWLPKRRLESRPSSCGLVFDNAEIAKRITSDPSFRGPTDNSIVSASNNHPSGRIYRKSIHR